MSVTVSVCLTCLSTTRSLYPIEDANFFASLTLLKLSDPSKCRLCWECYAAVRRAKLFRDKALKAHAILIGQCIPTNLPLSSLGCKELKDYIYIQGYPPVVSCEVNEATKPKQTHIGYEVYPPVVSCEVNEAAKPKQTHIGFEVCKDQSIIHREEVETCPLTIFDKRSGTNQRSEQELDSHPHVILVEAAPQRNTLHEELILKQEVIENDTEDVINNDPYDMDLSEAQEVQEVIEPARLDIVKCEGYSSSDDEPLVQVKQVNTAYIKINHVTDNQTEQNARSTPRETTLQYSPLESIPIEYEPPPPATPNVEDAGKCKIKTLTEKEMREVRKGQLEQIKKKYRYFCAKCLRSFRAKSFYESHMLWHKESAGEFKCNICELRFVSEDSLTAHASVLYRIITCNTCTAEFTTYRAFSRHHEKHEAADMACCNCGETFPNKSLWRKHVQKHQPFVECSVCKKQVRKNLLTTHAKTHLPQPLLSCDDCGKKFLGQYKFDMHMRVCHSPFEFGDAYCAECDKQFKTKSQYHMHLRSTKKHVKEKLIQCKLCPRKYTCMSYLNGHMARCHRSNDCKLCSQKFTSDYKLRRHVKLVHEQMLVAKDKICDYCGRGFAEKSTLRQHIYAHMNMRPYKCKYCGQGFNYNGAMYTHIKLKHKKEKRNR